MKVQCIQNVWTAQLKRLGSKLKNSNQKVTMPCLQGQKQSKYILEIPFKDIQNMSFSKVFPFQYWPTLVDALRGGSIEENEIPAGCRTEPSIITPNLSSFAVQLPTNYQKTTNKHRKNTKTLPCYRVLLLVGWLCQKPRLKFQFCTVQLFPCQIWWGHKCASEPELGK